MRYLILVFCLLLNGCLWNLGDSMDEFSELFLIPGQTLPDGRGLCEGAEEALVWGHPDGTSFLINLDQLPYTLDDDTEIFSGGIKDSEDPQGTAWCMVRVKK